MKGKSNSELATIDVELKEAVCDALVNALVDRVSGADERGRNLLGSSPRRGIFAGQLLPRPNLFRVALMGAQLARPLGKLVPGKSILARARAIARSCCPI